MFQRPNANHKDVIILDSCTAAMPGETNDIEKQALQQLQEMVELISYKYMIQNVKGRYNRSNPEEMSIIFEDSIYIGREKENKRPVEYLKACGGCLTQEQGPYPHLSKSVVTFKQSQCCAILQGLNLLASPSSREVEDRSHARMYAKC